MAYTKRKDVNDGGSSTKQNTMKGMKTATPIHRGPVVSTPLHKGPVVSTPIHRGPVVSTPLHKGPVVSTPRNTGSTTKQKLDNIYAAAAGVSKKKTFVDTNHYMNDGKIYSAPVNGKRGVSNNKHAKRY